VEWSVLVTIVYDSLSSGFANFRQSLKQPGFSPIKVDFLRLMFPYLGDVEFKLAEVSDFASATSSLDNILNGVLGF